MNKPAKFISATTVLLAALSLTACGTQPAVDTTNPMPAAVTETGMTLDWGPDVKQQALEMINGSAHMAYLDIYELSDPDILQALVNARQRGVDVRVVVDATESHSQDTAVPTLQKAGVPITSLPIHQGICHIKMLITDGKTAGVLIGGMNFGASSWQNNDASVYLSQPNPSFLGVFRWDWQRSQNQPAAAPSTQLPLLTDTQIGPAVVTAISRAQKSVRLEGFDVSDYDVIDALEADARRGVQVQVLLDPNQYLNTKTATTLRAAGMTVRFYRTYQNEWMHAKIVDVDEGKCFIIGSANFSHQAYTYNHEGDLELTNVPAFDKSLQQNLSVQLARGTDTPVTNSDSGN